MNVGEYIVYNFGFFVEPGMLPKERKLFFIYNIYSKNSEVRKRVETNATTNNTPHLISTEEAGVLDLL